MSTVSLRNLRAFNSGQSAWDNAPEPEGNADIDERICAIEAAEDLLAKARAELCNVRPSLLRVDGLMADAMRCLMKD